MTDTSHTTHSVTQNAAFGVLLRALRRRAGMTQADLAAAVAYSVSFISSLGSPSCPSSRR